MNKNVKVSCTAAFAVLQTFNLYVHQPTKPQRINLDATSAAVPVSTAVITSAAVVSCGTD